MENDLILYSMNLVRSMEIIDIVNGVRLGYVKDFKIDTNEQRVVGIIIPSPNKTWFGKDVDIEIPWDKVVKMGVDVLLVDGSGIEMDIE